MFLFRWLLVSSFILFTCSAYAQKNIGPIVPDSSFATAGISETDFYGYADEITAFDVLGGNLAPNRKIIVAGKIHTAIANESKFGMLQYTSEGLLDPTFGANGKTIVSWDSVDYPNAISIYPNVLVPSSDATILAAGASATTITPQVEHPAVFKFKTDGTPDSSFGGTGRVVMPFASTAAGACKTVRRIEVGYLVACGFSVSPIEGENGFGALWLKSDGAPDSAYGINGRVIIPAPVASATGYFTDDLKIIFAGVSTSVPHELLLGKLTEQGLPDSSFGIAGLLHTGILLESDSILCSTYLKGDNSGNLLLALRIKQSSVSFTLVKFKAGIGLLDSSYGQSGFAESVSTENLYPMSITISNDGSALIGCHASIGLGQCAAVKFFLNGILDTTFGTGGIALVDAFGGTKKNYLVGFNSIGGKKFIGIGAAGSGTDKNFLVARYRQAIATSDISAAQSAENGFVLYPNPANDIITISSLAIRIENISVVDAIGRIIRKYDLEETGSQPQSLDISGLCDGVYYCHIRSKNGVFVSPFIIRKY